VIAGSFTINSFANFFHKGRIFLFNNATDILKPLLYKDIHLLALHNAMRNISLDILWLALREPEDEQIISSELTVLLEVKESCLIEVIENELGLVNVGAHVGDHLLKNAHTLHVFNHQLLLLLHH
jgi:hypothetical protein